MRNSVTKNGRKTSFTLNRAILTVAGTAGLLPFRAEATGDNWNADSGNWNSAINWTNGIPVGGMDVNIVENDSTDRTIIYDYIGNAVTLNSLLVDNTGGGTNTFSQPGNFLTSVAMYAGSNGVGIINQSGGINNTKNLYLGYGNLGSGTYYLTNGSLNVDSSVFIGAGGTGSFIQSGGTHTILGAIGAAGKLYVGYNGGSGTYTLSRGDLHCIGIEYIGYNAQGVFNQNGGNNSGNLFLGYGANSASGTYNLHGGQFGGGIFVGYGGTGNFSQTGGTVYGGQIHIGYSNGTGSYTLNDGLLNSGNTFQPGYGSPGIEYVGSGGVGVFNQNGGTNTIYASNSAALSVGFNGGSGTYNLGGGRLDVLGNIYRAITTGGINTDQIGVEYVGSNGAGVFNQTGGAHTVSGSNGAILSIGYSNGTGQYDLTSGSLSVFGIGFGTARLVVGSSHGTGLFNLSGGTLSIGQVHTFGIPSEYVGSNGAGVFNQTGGTHTIEGGHYIDDPPYLNIGCNSGNGTYTLSGGVLTVNGGNESIGSGGIGVFNQTGGVHTVITPANGELDVGNKNGNGTYNLIDGSLAVSNYLIVGGSSFAFGNPRQGGAGTGVFNQSGGTVTVGSWLSIGDGKGDGTGRVGNGTYNMTGGTLDVKADINVSDLDPSVGVFNLMNGTVIAKDIFIGRHTGTATSGLLVQSGGMTTVTGYYGVQITNNGSYQLLGGVLASSGTGLLNLDGTLFVGTNAMFKGFGPFNQTGGTLTIAGTLNVDPAGGGAVTAYKLTGGTAFISELAGINGSTIVGNPTGGISAALTVNRFAVGSLLIDSTGTVVVAAATSRITNSTTLLTINGDGLLDLQNHHLLIDNTATPFTNVKQYIDAAYNRNPVTGVGDYNGRGGITSSVVKANTDFMGVGYYNGALQSPSNPDNIGQILGPNSNSGAGTGIPLTQILVRPTLTGDLNGDGVVNSYDVTLFNTFGLFNQPTNLGYQAGDLNGDGVVNAKDVTIFNTAGNFNNGSYLVAKAAGTLSGHSASPSAVLNPSSGTLAFTYDPATGDVKVNYNGFTGFAGKQTFNTTTRALSLIDILSTGGAFALDSTKLTSAANAALSSPTITGNTEINLTAVNGYLPAGTDLGPILAPGLDLTQLAGALTLTFNYTGSRQLSGGVAGLIPITPEPTTLSLIGFGALGLLARRRRPARR